MIAVARTRAYESATLYYLHPEWFFYYLSGLFAASDNDNTDDDDGTDTAANSIDPCGSGGTGDQDQDQEHHLLLLTELRTILRARLAERFGDPDHSDPWSLALRLVAARNLGLFRRRTSFSSSHGTEDQDARLERDIRKLRLSQARDGSFGAEKPWIYRYGHGLLVGNVGLVTAVAVRALRGFSS